MPNLGEVKADVRRLDDKLDGLRDKIDALRDNIDAVKDSIAAAKIWALMLYITLAAGMLATLARAFQWV